MTSKDDAVQALRDLANIRGQNAAAAQLRSLVLQRLKDATETPGSLLEAARTFYNNPANSFNLEVVVPLLEAALTTLPRT